MYDNNVQTTNLLSNQEKPTENIFDLDKFPATTRPIVCSPKELLEMLEKYALYENTIDALCTEYHINTHTFFKLCRTYPEIEQVYRLAQAERAELLAQQTMAIADDDSDDVLVQPDGRFTPNNANVRRSELRVKSRQYLMERYNPERFASRTKVENTTRALHIHAVTKLPPVDQLEDIGLDGLQDIQRSMRYGDKATQQSGATRR